jgi:hypothetical protein
MTRYNNRYVGSGASLFFQIHRCDNQKCPMLLVLLDNRRALNIFARRRRRNDLT